MARRTITILAVLVLGACANATTVGPGAGIEHPTSPDKPILTMRNSGGLVPAEYAFTEAPSFALYGDGTVVVPGAQIAIYPGPALPAMIARTIDEEGIQAILREALDAGLDRDGDYSDLGQMGIADAGTTRFELTVDGTTHVVTAYALGLEGSQQPGQPDAVWQVRQGLSELATKLQVLDWLPEGSAGAEHPYDASSGQVLVGPYRADGDLLQRPVDWPNTQDLHDLGSPAPSLGEGWRCAVLAGEDWAAVATLAAEANQLTPWVSGDRRYAVVFRPLLPDEVGCPPSG